jgi:hypothetical protein
LVIAGAQHLDGHLADAVADGEGGLGLRGIVRQFGVVDFEVDSLQALERGEEAGF